MAQDATGAPTSLGIPKYDTQVDAPSGKGFNAAMDSIDTLLQSRVTLAATSAWKTRLLSADANPAFQILGDGTHQWGPGGGTAVDVDLYRFAANHLATNDIFSSIRSAVSDTAFATRVSGDTISRFFMRADGQMQWSAGSGSMDCSFLRASAGLLQLQDNLQILTPTSTTQALFVIASGDTVSRFTARADGQLEWGSGSAGRDIALFRNTADQLALTTGDSLLMGTATGTNTFIQFFEQTSDPAAGAANTARLFAKDNGAGKTQLVVRFNTGATQVIATEP